MNHSKKHPARVAIALLFAAGLACANQDRPPPEDGGVPDSGIVMDTGTPDTGVVIVDTGIEPTGYAISDSNLAPAVGEATSGSYRIRGRIQPLSSESQAETSNYRMRGRLGPLQR